MSTEEQDLALQFDALRAAGCGVIFEDRGYSGSQRHRPGLDEALENLRPGDTLVVWRLDRLGRSLLHLIDTVDRLSARGVGFRSLTECFDTGSSGGRLIFHVMGALAEFERALIAERTRAGLAAARARGKRLGRPRKLTEDARQAVMACLSQGQGAREVAQKHGLNLRMVYRIAQGA